MNRSRSHATTASEEVHHSGANTVRDRRTHQTAGTRPAERFQACHLSSPLPPRIISAQSRRQRAGSDFSSVPARGKSGSLAQAAAWATMQQRRAAGACRRRRANRRGCVTRVHGFPGAKRRATACADVGPDDGGERCCVLFSCRAASLARRATAGCGAHIWAIGGRANGGFGSNFRICEKEKPDVRLAVVASSSQVSTSSARDRAVGTPGGVALSVVSAGVGAPFAQMQEGHRDRWISINGLADAGPARMFDGSERLRTEWLIGNSSGASRDGSARSRRKRTHAVWDFRYHDREGCVLRAQRHPDLPLPHGVCSICSIGGARSFLGLGLGGWSERRRGRELRVGLGWFRAQRFVSAASTAA